METDVVRVDSAKGRHEGVARATDLLNGGGLVAFPTETVYGLGACVAHPQAVNRLREVKSRQNEKSFTVHLGSRDAVADLLPSLHPLASRFMRKAWPGPLTIIAEVDDPSSAPAAEGLDADALTALYRDNTIGLRYPDDPVAEELLRGAQSYVVATSANLAGQPPPRSAENVLSQLNGKIDLLLDAGPTRYAKPSTIVRVSGGSYELLREGVYDARTIARLSTLGLLFVCTGNTCRSPMAAGFARAVLADRLNCSVSDLARHRVEVMSAGTAGGGGRASEHAVTAMADRGIDIAAHESRGLVSEEIRRADHIFAMTHAHRDSVIDMVPSAAERVVLLGDRDVHDPIGGSKREYAECAALIEEGVRARLQEVRL